ncbi:hypothetical protein SDC9_155513 [bioreactor metagenome]|uniref:Uncharacterized protein n=1 Tax=bioreactor metagenome TaxID=1076179 RepID=A0A645F1S1_9ZZZZ
MSCADLGIAFDLIRRDALLPEQMVEEHPRSRSRLSVGEDDVLRAQVMEIFYAQRVSPLDDDALRPVKDEDAPPFLSF